MKEKAKRVTVIALGGGPIPIIMAQDAAPEAGRPTENRTMAKSHGRQMPYSGFIFRKGGRRTV